MNKKYKILKLSIATILSLVLFLNSGNIQASNIKINNEVNPSYKIPYSIPYEVVYDEYKGARIYVTVYEHGVHYGGFINLVKYESGRGHRYTYKGSLNIVGSPF